MIHCETCGAPVREGAVACDQCGSKVHQPYAAAGWVPPRETQALEQDVGASPQETVAVPTAQVHPFVRNILGFIVMAGILTSTFAWGLLVSPSVLSYLNWYSTLHTFCYQAMIAIGVALATRLRGPDLSIGSMMNMSAILIAISITADRPLLEGIGIAVSVCMVWGLINGALISFLRAPAVIVTMLVSLLARALSMSLSEGRAIAIPGSNLMQLGSARLFFNIPVFSLLLLLLCAGILVLALLFAGRLFSRKPTASAARPTAVMLGYAFVALIAVMAGLSSLSRVGAASPSVNTSLDVNILFYFAAIQTSRLLDNGFAALGYAIVTAFILTILNTVLSLLALEVFFQSIIISILALILLCVACIARGGFRRVQPGYGGPDQGLFGYET